MSDVFSLASPVIVWLGPEYEDSALAIECFKTISSNIAVDWALRTITPLTTETNWADGAKPIPFSDAQMLAIWKLLNRDWFKRLWIWQEVWLARAAVVMCGTQSITWEDVRSGYYALYVKRRYSRFFDILHMSHIELVFGLCQSKLSPKLYQLIDYTKHSLCSDPRDKIFAPLSLLPEWERQEITPDYSKTTSEVYRDVVRLHITHVKRLDILTTVEMREQVQKAPSWTPDWAIPRMVERLRNSNAGGNSRASWSFEANGVLQVIGSTVTTIDLAEPFRFQEDQAPKEEIVREAQRVLQKLKLQDLHGQSNQKLRNLCRVLCSNHLSDFYSPPDRNYSSLAQAEEFVKRVLLHPTEDLEGVLSSSSQDERLLLEPLMAFGSGRNLFKCLDGRVGLGPRAASPGDKVVIWLGCSFAMILRPAQGGCYRVVGEAYCEGLMDGAALMGPLPEHFEMVSRYNERRELDYLGPYDKSSGTFRAEDPRLAYELPSGWTRKPHANDEFEPWFVNDETGEDMNTFDPRLTPEALRARGVELEEFRLV